MIKIACIGDSLTYGYLLENREATCYPTVLGDHLGEDYIIGNFGFNGAAMLTSNPKAFRHHENFKLSTLFDPDIVIILLGTNDANAANFTTVEAYIEDYTALIAHYRTLSAKPRIYLATPPVAAPGKNSPFATISAETVQLLASAVRDLGKQNRLAVIDLHKKTSDATDIFIDDGVHINKKGATLIASAVYRELSKK
ncbi:MAG: GDSL-type esterase/lipase family protein [Turicibacter sp.]|nr:GDSL-type esterase/lipase family protein [Turicibacter sp.]